MDASRDTNYVTTLLAVSSVDGETPVTLYANPTTHRLLVDLAGGGSGTVQTVAVASANGFAGSSDGNPSAPTLTLSTSITGILKGNGTAISAVTVGSGLTFDGTTLSATGGGTGTVTDVSVVTANGVSGSVATSTTTPAITLTLGAITPSSVQVSGLTASQIVLTDASKNLVSAAVATYPSLTELTYLKGVTSAIQTQLNAKLSTITVGTTTITSGTTTRILYDNAGVVGEYTLTGTGTVVVMQDTPTLTTPVIGAATGTSVVLAGAGAISSFSNTSDSASLQVMKLIGTRATPTANDEIYQSFNLNSSTGVSREFGRITTIGTTVTNAGENGALQFGVMTAGTLTNHVLLNTTAFRPVGNDTHALGSAATSWSDLFLSEGGVINWDNGDATLTQTGNVLALAGADLRVATADVGTNADSVPNLTSTSTFTNKTIIAATNVTTEITATTDSATPTPTGGSLQNAFDVTALAQAATFAAPSGTPANWNKLIIRIKDNGTARALSWNAIYVAGGVALPTTTVISKILTVGFIYNTANSLNKWMCIASSQEA